MEVLPWWSRSRACLRCGEPVATDDRDGAVCAECLNNPPPFLSTQAAFWYAPPVEEWVKALKFHRALAYGAALAQAIAENAEPRGELLIPVPLSAERQRSRGFNQAAEIARVVAHAWKIPWNGHVLLRPKKTAMQATLGSKERWANVAYAFRVVEPRSVRGRTVVVVDDVMTTGATLRAATEAVLAAGAREVHLIVAARAAAVPVADRARTV
ncbi:ComF family protein [Hydrogenophilus islandicus]